MSRVFGSVATNPQPYPVEPDPSETAPPDIDALRSLTPWHAEERKHEHRISQLERRVLNLEGELARLRKRELSLECDQRRVMEAIKITQQLFDCQPSVEVDHDPENPKDTFVVFTVAAAGDPQQVIQKQLEWHRQLDRVQANPENLFRISIDTP